MDAQCMFYLYECQVAAHHGPLLTRIIHLTSIGLEMITKRKLLQKCTIAYKFVLNKVPNKEGKILALKK